MKPRLIHIRLYRDLREEIDIRVSELAKMYECHMRCKKGCNSCCENFSIFPIEFFGIAEDLKNNPPQAGGDDCIFLISGLCTIYEYRPLICRTHGLPLLRMNEEGTNWELSTCSQNFTNYSFRNFTLENTLVEDVMNSRLFLLNRDFLQASEGNNFCETDKISMKFLQREDILKLLND